MPGAACAPDAQDSRRVAREAGGGAAHVGLRRVKPADGGRAEHAARRVCRLQLRGTHR